MSTIFLQQILSGRLLLSGQKSNFSVRFKFESITTNHLRFVVKCCKNVVDVASLFLQYFHNKLQVVSCYWFKFKSATKITFFPSIITTSNNLSPMICYKNVIAIAFLFFFVFCPILMPYQQGLYEMGPRKVQFLLLIVFIWLINH